MIGISKTPADSSHFWAVTCFFNPAGYQSRVANYRVFRRHLTVPLVAVELSFDGEFQLRNGDADILVQVTGGDIMWQKERLLNIACQSVPRCCTKIACLDCDVVFSQANWAERASGLLDDYAVVQLFENVHHLARGVTPNGSGDADAVFTQRSMLKHFHAGMPKDELFTGIIKTRHAGTAAHGFAWAYRREVLNTHGLYDVCILGGGDRAMAAAALGRMDGPLRVHNMNEQQTAYYRGWAERYFETVQSNVFYLDAEIFHLWHGEMRHRKGQERHDGLQQFDFDPYRDIAKDGSGCWRWNSNKPELHRYVKGYFDSRREDGSTSGTAVS